MPLFRKRKPAISAEHRRALRLLASSSDGCPEALMQAHGFPAALLAELIGGGLASAETRNMSAGGRVVSVRRLWITDAGRQAL